MCWAEETDQIVTALVTTGILACWNTLLSPLVSCLHIYLRLCNNGKKYTRNLSHLLQRSVSHLFPTLSYTVDTQTHIQYSTVLHACLPLGRLSWSHLSIVLAVSFGSLLCWNVNRRLSLWALQIFFFFQAPESFASIPNSKWDVIWLLLKLASSDFVVAQNTENHFMDFMTCFCSWPALWIVGDWIRLYRCT